MYMNERNYHIKNLTQETGQVLLRAIHLFGYNSAGVACIIGDIEDGVLNVEQLNLLVDLMEHHKDAYDTYTD